MNGANILEKESELSLSSLATVRCLKFDVWYNRYFRYILDIT